MSLEDFMREVQGKPPRDRDMLERWAFSDEDGCSFDREAFVVPVHLGVGIACFGAMLLVSWASGGAEWQAVADTTQWLWGLLF